MQAAADRGSVTVEAALTLAALAVVTAAAVGSIAAVTATVRCTDAARELARLSARGDIDRGKQVAAQLAPANARIVVTIHDDEVTAEVSADAVWPLPLRVGAHAVAVLEPGERARKP